LQQAKLYHWHVSKNKMKW